MQKETVINGMTASLPIIVSYIALGIACGIVLFDAGFSLMGIFWMSLFTYAGAAQFLTASMVTMGATFPSIIVMVFFLNLRHVLMSASLSPYVKNKSFGFIGFFSHLMSDESFGINYSRFKGGHWSTDEALVMSVSNFTTWVISTVIGGAIGSQIPINTVIMNYALIAMFLCMMVQQFVSRAHLIAGVTAVIATVVLKLVFQHNIALVFATVIASFVGYFLESSTDFNKKGSRING